MALYLEMLSSSEGKVWAGLTFSYNVVHNQAAWVKLLGKIQGSLGRVLISL